MPSPDAPGTSPDGAVVAPDATLSCSGSTPDSCAGTCVSLQTSASHCGSCGHDCLGGACLGGRCQATLVATGFSGGNLLLTATDAYVLDYGSGGRVLRISKSSGAITPVVFGRVGGIAVRQDSLYWTLAPTFRGTDGKVIRAGLDGARPEEIATGQATPQAIIADDSGIYWVNRGTAANDGAVMSLPSGSASATVFADAQAGPGAIAVDSTSVYWFTVGLTPDGSDGAVYKRAKSGGNIVPLAELQPNATGSPFSLAVRGGRVFWAPRGLGNTDGRVRSISANGGTVTEFAGNQVRPQGVEADDSFVYWIVYGNGNDGVLQKASLSTKEITQLAGSLANPLDIAIDGAAIYFTLQGNAMSPGGLMRIVK